MTEWYEVAYPGAPMVGPPLPRPLYPPDAVSRGKSPSGDGKDILAIKRGLWRGGRWPGPAANFDDTYSNAFAHGRGPNVVDTGMAGFQRQMHIDDTGWMGEATYNALRSALIPQGLPNSGEHLLDQVAIDLLNDYVRQAGGTVRERALDKAMSYIGYKESPSGTNGNQFGAWYGMNYEPWCFMFVTYCFEMVGPSPTFVKGSRYAYCPYGVDDATHNRNGLSVTSSPKAGDLVFYDWQHNGVYDHVGIFESGNASSWWACEGNTSTSNNSNGGQVMHRSRNKNDARVLFVRVAEP